MKAMRVSGGYLLVLKRGEQLVENLTRFCTEHIIRGGWLQGLGAVGTAELGYYQLEQQQYQFSQLKGPLELVSLVGNVAIYKNEIFLHIHATLSNQKLQTFGGHLKEATVAGTVEINLTVLDKQLERYEDKDTGLKLIK